MVDGDTVVVAGVGTVRYVGIDTPELHHPTKAAAALGTARTRREPPARPRPAGPHRARPRNAGRYGRLLGYVYVGDVMVNAVLVRRGLARTLPIAPNTAHAAMFATLERAARQARIGLWGSSEGGPPWGVP